jgi:hypothetical protein
VDRIFSAAKQAQEILAEAEILRLVDVAQSDEAAKAQK